MIFGLFGPIKRKKVKVNQEQDDVLGRIERAFPENEPKTHDEIFDLNAKRHNQSLGNWVDDKYAERLIKEWLEHGKIVLAVDFDDTLFPWSFKGFAANVSFSSAMQTIRLAQRVGCYISIWSACDPSRHDEIRAYCESNDIRVDSVNENPIPLPYGNNRKMYYNHLLDDRAGLEQALSILNYACWRVVNDRKPKTQNFDI